MNIKNMLAALLGAVGIVESAQAAVDLYETYKDKTFTGEVTSLSANETFTLSNDYKFQKSDGTAVGLCLNPGQVFDFTDGNHILKAAGVRVYANATGMAIAFKGGVWDFCKGALSFGGWSNLNYADWTWTLDNVVFTNMQSSLSLLSGYGSNRRVLLKGATFYGGSEYTDLAPMDQGGVSYGGLIEFAAGSKFLTNGSVFDDRNSARTIPMNFTLRFTGAGSAYGRLASGKSNDFYLGYKAPCSRLEVLDGATFDTRWLKVGNHEYGDSNTVYIADGYMYCGYDTVIGNAAGADYNALFVTGPNGLYTNNASCLMIGGHSSHNSLTVSNGAQVVIKSLYLAKNGGDATAVATNNVVRVLDKGLVKLADTFEIGCLVNGSGSLVEIDGGTVQVTEKVLLGTASTDNRIVLRNKGLLKTPKSLEFRMGHNAVDVYSGATVDVNSVSLGIETGSDGNRLRILGGTVKTPNTAIFSVGSDVSKGDELVVSNGVLIAQGLQIGKPAGSDGNVVRMLGENARLDFPTNQSWTLFGNGCSNLFEVADDAALRIWRLYMVKYSTNNTMRVTRGAKLTIDDYCWIAEDTDSVSTNNVMEISDGAVLTSYGDLRNSGNTILVSNATARCKGTYATFFTGRGKVRLCGTHPLITTFDNDKAHQDFRDYTELTVALPTDGTVYAQAPLQAADGVRFHDTSMIRFENLEAFRSNLTQRVDVPLAESFGSESKNTVSDAFLTKVNAALVEQGCPWAKVMNSADKKLTYLRVRPDVGMILIVR